MLRYSGTAQLIWHERQSRVMSIRVSHVIPDMLHVQALIDQH